MFSQSHELSHFYLILKQKILQKRSQVERMVLLAKRKLQLYSFLISQTVKVQPHCQKWHR